MAAKMTVPRIREHKVSTGDDPLVMLTAYDAPSARMVDSSGADIILVGDSVAMVVLGYEDTLQVTVDDIAAIIVLCLRHRLRKDPLESIAEGNKVEKIFKEIFEIED